MKRSQPPTQDDGDSDRVSTRRQTRASARLQHNAQTAEALEDSLPKAPPPPPKRRYTKKQQQQQQPAEPPPQQQQQQQPQQGIAQYNNNDPQQLVGPLVPLSHQHNPSLLPAFGGPSTATAKKQAQSKTQAAKGPPPPRYQRLSVVPPSITFVPPRGDGPHISTVADIIHSLGPFTLTASNIAPFRTEPCSSCLQQYTQGDSVVISPCMHKFHADCLTDWFVHRHEQALHLNLEPLQARIYEYQARVAEFNAQFRPVSQYIFDNTTQTHTVVMRDPTNDEIARFNPPPPQPMLDYPQRVECDILCPTCWCDWGQLVMAPPDDFAMGEEGWS